ncbi:hypothetical protein [Liquorilactobacillus hordei]|nr:hypothetical protein [Liquorilactobacillus hordei]QYH51647.1 hypothetical protein G6O70_03755 [Liquorilactobacillus hordei DSM 19519]
MKKKLIICLVVMMNLLLIGCGKGQAKQDSSKNYATSTNNQNNSPYQNLSKSKAEQVKKADTAVKNVFNANDKAEQKDAKTDPNVVNRRPDNYVAPIVSKAEDKAATAIAEIKGNDTNTKDIRRAYTDVVNVVKDSSLINMQTVRSHIADLKNSKLATHMEKEYEQSMVVLVVTHTNYAESQVLDMTKPLSEKKLKVAQAKAAAAAASSSSASAAESSNMAKMSSEETRSSSASQATSATQATSTTRASTNTNTTQSTTSHATQASATPARSAAASYHAAASSTYHAPAKSSTQAKTPTASSYHNNTVPQTSSASIQSGNITGTNTTAGRSMDGGW